MNSDHPSIALVCEVGDCGNAQLCTAGLKEMCRRTTTASILCLFPISDTDISEIQDCINC